MRCTCGQINLENPVPGLQAGETHCFNHTPCYYSVAMPPTVRVPVDLLLRWARLVDDEMDLDGVSEGLRRWARASATASVREGESDA
jgi:hypothetical protein